MTSHALTILTLIFCFAAPPATLLAQTSDLVPNVETYPMPFPARRGDVDWGLALSGGGLRSAAFSIGAMKALYDLDLLADIDVISSVSGGGYASYWLYSRFDAADGRPFGYNAFHGDEFSRSVCSLASKSEFFPFRRMVGAAFSSRGKAFRKYRDSIEHSFGLVPVRDCDHREDCYPRMRKIRDLLPEIESGEAPYFIINTTIENGETTQKKLSKVEKSFELAPTYRGSDALGYKSWDQPDANITTWCDAVAMSGAGIRFKLSRTIDNYSPLLAEKDIDLADGGLSENLAALPLIMRGVKNIVIVDAENDPGYKFISYRRLKEHLQSRKINLNVEKVDTFLRNRKRLGRRFTSAAVSIGDVKAMDGYTGPAIGSRIYYVKMSRPSTIFPADISGIELEKIEKHKRKLRPSSCEINDLERIDRTTLRRDMLAYAKFLNRDWPWGKFFAFLPYINYNFPQLTTVDQTFYNDQLKAFIGLGYLEMCEMESAGGLAKSCTAEALNAIGIATAITPAE